MSVIVWEPFETKQKKKMSPWKGHLQYAWTNSFFGLSTYVEEIVKLNHKIMSKYSRVDNPVVVKVPTHTRSVLNLVYNL